MIPDIEITENGIVAPTTDEVLAGVWEMLKTAFGSNLNTAMNTPQGQLATSITAVIQNERNKWIQLMNQIDPQYSTGIWQDAIGELYFIDRQSQTFSIAEIRLHGLNGTIVPAGYRIGDVAGNIWETTSQLIIDSTGYIDGFVQCTVAGPIEASIDTITNILIALSGLDRATNTSAAIAGVNAESAENFEQRRQESVSANAKLTDAAVRGAVANLPNVVDVWVKSNPTDATVNFGVTNYPVTRNTLLCSVVGGVDYDIAWQILVKGGTGCSFAGDTEVTVYDNDTYPVDPPDYKVKFLRPTLKTVKFKITLEDKNEMSLQDEKAMKTAILDALKTGKARARIGQKLRASAYVCPVGNSVDLSLIDIEVSFDGTTWVNFLELGVDEYPVTTEFDIEIV